MSTKARIIASTALLGLAGYSLSAAPALAQNGSDEVARSDEIIVTAQRRAEREQDVPVAMTVVTASEITSAGLSDVRDLGNLAAGLNITRFGGTASPRIRGVGSAIISEGQDNSVSIYINGVLQQSAEAALFSLSNLQQIEVLRGPQGTLFGRNSTGGVISVTTRAPSQDASADFTIGYGSFETIEGSLYATTGIGDHLAADIAIYGLDQNEGWGTNLFDGSDIFTRDSLLARTQWLLTPTEDTEITIAASYFNNYEENRAVRPAEGYFTYGGYGFPGYYNINANAPAFVDREGYDLSANVSQDLGWAKLVNILAYSYVDADTPADPDAGPLAIANLDRQSTVNEGWTEELQLQSNPGSNILGVPTDWILGFYYLTSSAGYLPRGNSILLSGSIYGAYAPIEISGTLETASYSGFGQATFTVAPNTHVTAGLRFTSDERTLNNEQTYLWPLLPQPPNHQEETFDRLTYKATIDHQFGDDLMVYFTNSTGFKAGTFNIVGFGNPSVRPELLTAYEAGVKSSLFDGRVQVNAAAYHYDYTDIQAQVYTSGGGATTVRLINAASATVDGFDLDISASPTDHLNLRAGLAYTDAVYESFPTATFYRPIAVVSPCAVPFVNCGGATQFPGDASGKRIVNSPEWSFNVGGDYTIPLNVGQIVLSAQYSYQSEFYWDFENTFEAESRDLVSASAAWEVNDNYQIRVWGRNLLESEYSDQGQISTFGYLEAPAAPRTFGVELTARFN